MPDQSAAPTAPSDRQATVACTYRHSEATPQLAGPRQPDCALVQVRDPAGRTAPGILVRLTHEGKSWDQSRTDVHGVVLLRCPAAMTARQRDWHVEVLADGFHCSTPVTQPDGRVLVVEVVVDPLPGTSGSGGRARPQPGEAILVERVQPDDDPADDPKDEDEDAIEATPTSGGSA